jgi:hypothetical protein
MTDLPFLLNGVDFSARVKNTGYTTDRVPVFAKQYTDLNLVSHDVIGRYRDTLKVTLNPMTEAEAETLCRALLVTPLKVTFRSAQTGQTKTDAMRCVTAPAELALTSLGVRYYNVGTTLTFEQL